MVHLRGAVIGIVAFLGVVAGIVVTLVYFGYAPMRADDAPSALEANLAMRAIHTASERAMGDRKSPLDATPANLAAGLAVYRQNCILCHGAADGKPSNIATGFYIPSPQFATDGAEDDPEGATYWKIHHGIRFSAMPAFAASLSDVQIWQVAMFLKHMDHLPAEVAMEWKATKSVGSGANQPAMHMK